LVCFAFESMAAPGASSSRLARLPRCTWRALVADLMPDPSYPCNRHLSRAARNSVLIPTSRRAFQLTRDKVNRSCLDR
jgi:hypothetical protein